MSRDEFESILYLPLFWSMSLEVNFSFPRPRPRSGLYETYMSYQVAVNRPALQISLPDRVVRTIISRVNSSKRHLLSFNLVSTGSNSSMPSL